MQIFHPMRVKKVFRGQKTEDRRQMIKSDDREQKIEKASCLPKKL
jgi:hypothetical protein